jgi:hypothetical protein
MIKNTKGKGVQMEMLEELKRIVADYEEGLTEKGEAYGKIFMRVVTELNKVKTVGEVEG